ncbi:MAG TPA: response regulator [Anaerohalosphaeraceae bacterium]|nr:response regulator [Anaerohalosphaeraceae bacterium]
MSQTAPTILIAEDDFGHFALIQKNLKRSCVPKEIIHFRNGEELLNFLFHQGPERLEGGRYLILMDIRLPGKNGIEVLRCIKEDPTLYSIPVFMLTTSTNPADVERSYELGCAAYMNKPGNYSEFVKSVDRLGHLISLSEFDWPPLRYSSFVSR